MSGSSALPTVRRADAPNPQLDVLLNTLWWTRLLTFINTAIAVFLGGIFICIILVLAIGVSYRGVASNVGTMIQSANVVLDRVQTDYAQLRTPYASHELHDAAYVPQDAIATARMLLLQSPELVLEARNLSKVVVSAIKLATDRETKLERVLREFSREMEGESEPDKPSIDIAHSTATHVREIKP